MVMQCALAGGDFSDVEPYEAEDIIDEDSVDDDDDPYVDRARTWGVSLELLRKRLTWKQRWRAVRATSSLSVRGTEVGPYELRVKQID